MKRGFKPVIRWVLDNELVTICDWFEIEEELPMNKVTASIDETIKTKIYTIRGMQVMLDRDLAELYDVETRALKQAVKRNIDRFPNDFMIEQK